MASLDTSVFVDLRGRDRRIEERALGKLEELRRRGAHFVTTRFTLAELYVGIARADDPPDEERMIKALLGNMRILEFDERAARLYGSITASLQSEGRPCGDMDVLIVATSLSAGHIVVTRNPDHFRRMPGLTVESY